MAGLAFGLEFTHTSKACKKIGDLVYQLLELNEDDNLNIQIIGGTHIHTTKKDFVVSKNYFLNYYGKDLSGLKVLVDVNRQSFIKLKFVKGMYFRVYQTSRSREFYEHDDNGSYYLPTYIKLVFAGYDQMQAFETKLKERDARKKAGKEYCVPVLYCNLVPTKEYDMNGNEVTVWQAKVYDKSLIWIDEKDARLL